MGRYGNIDYNAFTKLIHIVYTDRSYKADDGSDDSGQDSYKGVIEG